MSVYRTDANRLRTVRITAVKTESPTVKTFSFKDKECARAKPGQFLMLWIPGVDEIPLSILDATRDGAVSVAVKRVGEASQALHERHADDIIGLRGPFGNYFTVKGRRTLMVGGGTGIAPLLFLMRKLISMRIQTTFVMGAKTKDELLFKSQIERLRRKGVKLLTSTEDGTCGLTGLCTEPLERMLTRDEFDMIYACGPEQMIHKVFELAEDRRVSLQASLERLMRCAIGLCGSCVIGRYRVCTDGPVFTSKELKQVTDEFGLFKRDQCGRKAPLD